MHSEQEIDVSKLKAILFDLGGVLLNIDYMLTERAFIDLGVSNFNELYNQHRQSGLFKDYEKGEISSSSFISQLKEPLQEKVNDDALKNAWNAMLLDFPVEHLNLLRDVRKQYHTLLLSNTNDLHYNEFSRRFKQDHSLDFNGSFHKTYYSHHMGMRKPDAEIFEKVLDEQGLAPNEVLFIDDTEEHVISASVLNIQTLHLKNEKTSSLLRRVGVLA